MLAFTNGLNRVIPAEWWLECGFSPIYPYQVHMDPIQATSHPIWSKLTLNDGKSRVHAEHWANTSPYIDSSRSDSIKHCAWFPPAPKP